MVGTGLQLSAPKGKVSICITFEENGIELIFSVYSIKIYFYLPSKISNYINSWYYLTVHIIYDILGNLEYNSVPRKACLSFIYC